MANVTELKPKRKPQDETRWYEVQNLISALGVSGNLKHLLRLIHIHTQTKPTHPRCGWAWTAQTTLAAEMSTDESTVRRAFRKAEELGIVEVRRVRTGRMPYTQFNEYRIVLSKLKENTLATPGTMPGTHRANSPSSTGHHARRVFKYFKGSIKTGGKVQDCQVSTASLLTEIPPTEFLSQKQTHTQNQTRPVDVKTKPAAIDDLRRILERIMVCNRELKNETLTHSQRSRLIQKRESLQRQIEAKDKKKPPRDSTS